MKKRFNTLVLTLVACYCLSILPMIFMGCANSSGSGSSGNGTEEGSGTEAGTETVTPPKTISSVIGAAGGQVGDDNAMISIPAGALKEDTEISIKYLNDAKDVSESILMGFVGAVEFGPTGTKFNTPAEVYIKLTEIPENKTLSIFCYDDETETWNYETSAQIIEDFALFEIKHFSKYRLLNLTPAVYEKYFEIVNDAVSNNSSDSSITDAYLNYLVNTLDMMNRCEVWNGQLFKVCGIWFSGDYVINGKEGNTEDLRCVYGDTTDESHVIRGSKTTDKFKVINKTESQKIITIYLNVHFKPVETLHFKGHIAEEFMWEFDIISSDWHNRESSGKKTGSSRGKEKFNVEYDYSGFIFIEDDKKNGSISFENIKTKVIDEAATKSIHVNYYNDEGKVVGQEDRTLAISLFDNTDIYSKKLKCNLKGTCNDGICELVYDCGNNNLITIDGDFGVEGSITDSSGSLPFESSAFSLMRIRVGDNNTPLYSFSIDPEKYNEEQISEKTELKDDFDLVLGLSSIVMEYYESSPELLTQLPEWSRRDANDDFVFDSDFKLDGDVTSIKTTQTITVEKAESK